MSFAGWALADLGLLFGAFGIAITGLYLLRMRRRQVQVPFAALWERVTRESETRRLWKRLRRLFSWLIQLILLALVCLALGDPRPEMWLREPRTTAIVVDVSSSMAASSGDLGDGKSRLDEALARVRAEVEALGPADRMLIIAAGPEVSVPAPLGGETSSLLRALEGVRAVPGEADMVRALALARNALAGLPDPHILVLTDGALGTSSASAVADCVVAEGEDAMPCALAQYTSEESGNVAITAFAARRYPSDREKVEVLAELQNLGPKPASVILDVTADGISVGRRTIALAPGERKRELLPELDAARNRLVATLQPAKSGDPEARNALGPSNDDRAWAVVPPLEPLEVTLITDGTNLFLEAALLVLDDHVRLTGLGVDDAGDLSHPALSEADVIVYDLGKNPLPSSLPEHKSLVLFDPHRHENSPSPIELAKQLVRPRLSEQKRKHGILTGVVFKDVNMHRGTSFKTKPGDEVLVSHLGDPVVVLREEDERAVLAVGFDPRQSDLPLRTAFPLLVANTIDYFARREAGFVASVPVGSSRELALADLGLGGGEVSMVEVTAPHHNDDPKKADPAQAPRPHRVRVQNGRFRLRALEPGVHIIRALDGDAAGAEVEVAVNQASAAASSLVSKLPEDVVEAGDAGAAPSAAPIREGPLWTLILLIVAGIVTLEWASYHRRQTV